MSGWRLLVSCTNNLWCYTRTHKLRVGCFVPVGAMRSWADGALFAVLADRNYIVACRFLRWMDFLNDG